ncbi:hypothetical protein EKG38_22305 [Shewanella canadensis]|uniref:Uncharacterized protein n=1 Tax=Shewanella canadensis TaxID=271096 RepID=A0A3S0LJ76_9GAMM|nr:hypothetical protein [Shewanella canadensis]RTR36722.1 hypothetical protein EKG38_22305 [Shewanella canadensis]
MQLNGVSNKNSHSRRSIFRLLGLIFMTVPFLVAFPASADHALAKCTSESKSLWAADNLSVGWKKANEKQDQRIRRCLVKINSKKINRGPKENLEPVEDTHDMIDIAVTD